MKINNVHVSGNSPRPDDTTAMKTKHGNGVYLTEGTVKGVALW